MGGFNAWCISRVIWHNGKGNFERVSHFGLGDLSFLLFRCSDGPKFEAFSVINMHLFSQMGATPEKIILFCKHYLAETDRMFPFSLQRHGDSWNCFWYSIYNGSYCRDCHLYLHVHEEQPWDSSRGHPNYAHQHYQRVPR